ncbi:MAG: SpoIID/LytB domain-containing protein [Planctomycetes bacterium]|nr:SpoIID/LytB domain-containing protein [Planctomycetota bacterium]
MRKGPWRFLLLALMAVSGMSCQKLGLRDMDRVRNYICLSGPPTMRVSVLRNVSSVTVYIDGPFKIVDPATQRMVRDGRYFPPTAITVDHGAFKIGSVPAACGALRIISADPRGVTLRDVSYRTEHVKEITYRGEIELQRTGGKMDVLNIVDVETYLAGVLGSEVPLYWPDSALRAQAIVSRTYALFQKKMNQTRDYDVVATIGDQKYLGAKAEDAKSRRIVGETRGIVLFYKNHLFPTYFHSTCGGHTEEVSYLLDSRSIEPLKGVPCPYCRESKYFKKWTETFTEKEIRDKLRRQRYKVGTIISIRPYEFGPGGRARMLEIVSNTGTVKMRAYAFRLALGSTRLRNTNFTVRKIGNAFEFKGNGYGHGIGMCQFGAMGQAKQGRSAIDIVEYYYPGVEVAKIY